MLESDPMKDDKQLSRRSFLQTAGFLAGTVALGNCLEQRAAIAQVKDNTWHYSLGDWTGDDFTIGHEMRDAKFPKFPAESESTVDFAIIGGGIAGLAAAHYLKDHNYILLEQYAELGGQNRGASYNGIDYSFGGTRIDKPKGEVEQLFHNLNLHPQLEITTNEIRYKLDPDIKHFRFSSNPEFLFKDGLRELDRFIEEAKPIWASIDGKPLTGALLSPQISSLDKISFKESLTSFSPAFVEWLDSVCRVSNCLGVDRISALAGFIATQILVKETAMFKGGNTAISKALINSIETRNERVKTNTFVWAIDIKDDHAMIIFSDKEKAVHKVKCRHVIIASPLLVSARILRGIDDQIKAKMLGFKYGSYLVANFLLKKSVMDGCAMNWLGAPYAVRGAFLADVPYRLDAARAQPTTENLSSVLTLYQPFAPGSEGRTILLEGDKENLAKTIATQLEPVLQQLPSQLDKVVLSRWGHAMIAPTTGALTKISQLYASVANNPIYSLAHSSVHGSATVESAVTAAKAAVDNALKAKRIS